MRSWRDERGSAVLLPIYWTMILLLIITGVAGYYGAAGERARLERALNAAVTAAAAQVDPLSVLAGQPVIDAARAHQAFDAAFPTAGGYTGTLEPQSGETWLAGSVTVEQFTVYGAGDRGKTNPAGQTVPGPAVYAQVAAPVWLRLLGSPVTAITVRAAVMQAVPTYDAGQGGWR